MPRRREPPMMSMDPVLAPHMPLTEPRILLAANWVKDTTLLYGGSISTAFTVAGLFAAGLEQEMRKQPSAEGAPDA